MPTQLGDDDFFRCHLVNHPVFVIDIGISTLIVDRNYRAVLAHTGSGGRARKRVARDGWVFK